MSSLNNYSKLSKSLAKTNMKRIKQIIPYLLPLILVGLIWEFSAISSDKIKFLFASPSLVLNKFIEKTINGELLIHFGITSFEVFVGLIFGLFVGSCLGFLLLYNPRSSKIATPYVIALASVPIFGIAPMMIIWFGIGIPMKIAMVFFSTVFVAISQAFNGGLSVPKEEIEFFKLNKASNKTKFWNLVFPFSMDWLIQSLKINAGLAILGAFIGEFIASDKGLGYIILKAEGLYDIPYVLAAILYIIILSFSLNYIAESIQKNKITIIRKITSYNQPKINI